MDFISQMVLKVMCLLFPLSIYIVGKAFFRNLDSKKDEIFLEIALYSSVYLLIKYGGGAILIYPRILLNIPLLIAYLKKKNHSAIIISVILVLYYNLNTNIDLIYLIVEYIVYFITYQYILSKKYTSINIITNFIVIKSFVMSFEMFLIFSPDSNIIINFISIFLVMLVFTLIAYLILYFLNRGEEIMELNSVIHELEKEKKLRESLFKITHEIKNPIAVCKGYLDMMDYKDLNKVKRYNGIIKDEINRTLILMDDFLDYTKIKVEKDITDVYLLVEDTCDIMRVLFKKHDISLEVSIPDDEVYINLDYNRMKQVLVNILKNCIEAKDNNKSKNYVSIIVEKRKDEVIIKIKDNGVGMDKNTLSKVDEMFYTTKEKGTGLGVPLSKEIINQHSGHISYVSFKNKYTQVTISLPI